MCTTINELYDRFMFIGLSDEEQEQRMSITTTMMPNLIEKPLDKDNLYKAIFIALQISSVNFLDNIMAHNTELINQSTFDVNILEFCKTPETIDWVLRHYYSNKQSLLESSIIEIFSHYSHEIPTCVYERLANLITPELLSKTPNHTINSMLSIVCHNCNARIVQNFIVSAHIENNNELLTDGFFSACHNNNIEVVELLYSYVGDYIAHIDIIDEVSVCREISILKWLSNHNLIDINDIKLLLRCIKRLHKPYDSCYWLFDNMVNKHLISKKDVLTKDSDDNYTIPFKVACEQSPLFGKMIAEKLNITKEDITFNLKAELDGMPRIFLDNKSYLEFQKECENEKEAAQWLVNNLGARIAIGC